MVQKSKHLDKLDSFSGLQGSKVRGTGSWQIPTEEPQERMWYRNRINKFRYSQIWHKCQIWVMCLKSENAFINWGTHTYHPQSCHEYKNFVCQNLNIFLSLVKNYDFYCPRRLLKPEIMLEIPLRFCIMPLPQLHWLLSVLLAQSINWYSAICSPQLCYYQVHQRLKMSPLICECIWNGLKLEQITSFLLLWLIPRLPYLEQGGIISSRPGGGPIQQHV